ELPAEAPEERAIRLAHRSPLPHRLELVAVERDVLDLDRDALGRVLRHLEIGAQIDREPHAVIGERIPAGGSQDADRVRAYADAERRLAAAFERQSSEIADVDAPVPAEDPVRDWTCLR